VYRLTNVRFLEVAGEEAFQEVPRVALLLLGKFQPPLDQNLRVEIPLVGLVMPVLVQARAKAVP
jgi:hypothetical protein